MDNRPTPETDSPGHGSGVDVSARWWKASFKFSCAVANGSVCNTAFDDRLSNDDLSSNRILCCRTICQVWPSGFFVSVYFRQVTNISAISNGSFKNSLLVSFIRLRLLDIRHLLHRNDRLLFDLRTLEGTTASVKKKMENISNIKVFIQINTSFSTLRMRLSY